MVLFLDIWNFSGGYCYLAPGFIFQKEEEKPIFYLFKIYNNLANLNSNTTLIPSILITLYIKKYKCILQAGTVILQGGTVKHPAGIQ